MPTENNNQPRDLVAELMQETEKKLPTANANSNSWNFAEDDEKEIIPGKAAGNDTPAAETKKESGPLTPDQIRKGAVATAAMIHFLTSLASEAIITIRFHLKLTSEQRELLDTKLLDTPNSKLSEEEIFLKNRKQRLDEKRDKKLSKISISDAARKRMEDACEAYSIATGKVLLSPGAQIAAAISEAFITSALEAFID